MEIAGAVVERPWERRIEGQAENSLLPSIRENLQGRVPAEVPEERWEESRRGSSFHGEFSLICRLPNPLGPLDSGFVNFHS